jgi:hypothetical protein
MEEERGGTSSMHEKCRQNLIGKREGKRPLQKISHGWEDNIKMVLKCVGCENVDSIRLAQDRVQ